MEILNVSGISKYQSFLSFLLSCIVVSDSSSSSTFFSSSCLTSLASSMKTRIEEALSALSSSSEGLDGLLEFLEVPSFFRCAPSAVASPGSRGVFWRSYESYGEGKSWNSSKLFLELTFSASSSVA